MNRLDRTSLEREFQGGNKNVYTGFYLGDHRHDPGGGRGLCRGGGFAKERQQEKVRKEYGNGG